MSTQNARDTHFFLAGWNGQMQNANATLHFQQATEKAPPQAPPTTQAAGPEAAAAPVADSPEQVEQRERWLEIGKALERACAELPDDAEIIVSMEKHAGTVTLIDTNGIEHENFQHEEGLAGVINEATDTAIAIAAKKGGTA